MNVRNRPLRIVALLGIVSAVAAAMAIAAENAPKPAGPAKTGGDPALFDPIASVVMHPRCMNCHQVDFPRQTDAGIRHTQLVVRGTGGTSAHDGGHGAPTLQCQTCHQASNTADGRVPGTPNWQLAPASMKWEGLSKAQICEQLKDPERNGHRTTAKSVVEHMGAYGSHTDPLVLWAWNPGAHRSTPPISHAEFVKALEAWAEAGMPCPSATDARTAAR